MAFLNAAGERLEYDWHGPAPDRAPTLVFLHEGLGSASMWRDFPARLAAATGCGALVYSRRGYGRSDPIERPRPVTFMHDEADRVLPAVLDAAGVADAILVGHSDGASIALLYAGRGGDRLRGVIVEAPHVFVEDVTVASIAEIKEIFRTTDLREKLARHHGDNVDGAFWGWNDAWLDPDFRAWNIEDCLPGIAVPLLVVQGEDDQYGTAAQVEAVARRAGGPCEIVMLPACGHSPHREQAEATLAAMTRFVAGLRRPAAATPAARETHAG